MRTVSDSCPRVIVWLVVAFTEIGLANAAELAVDVTDRMGDAVPNVAVYLMPAHDTPTGIVHSGLPRSATMEQIDNAFVPHMLIVETGTEVSFPNNDTVSHHVYSFSETRRFQLDLYRGNVHPPQLFDRPGLVVLGCNIHDSMLAYILVVDTPWSSITTADGTANFARLPEGEYEVFVWTPRANSDDLPAPQSVVIESNGNAALSVQLTGKLSPPHDSVAGSLSWERY